MTNVASQKLQKLLLSDDCGEISDFPSPTLPKTFRKSAPPRLFFKKKSKEKCPRNDFLRIVNCFRNDNDESPQKKIENNSNLARNNPKKRENNNINVGNGGRPISDVGDTNFGDQNGRKESVSDKIGKSNLQNGSENLKSKNVNVEISKKIGEDKRYSRVYDVQSSCGSDSSSLFYTFKPAKKSEKPTIVFTYFNQK